MQENPGRIHAASTLAKAAVVALLASQAALVPSARAQTIPTDAKAASPQVNCVVSPAMFNSWFVSGTPTLNGVVNPANSVTFPNTPNCSFYQWSMQMFLWLTSPAPASYGGGSRIMDSPVFYDVSPSVNGQRTYIPHSPGLIRHLPVRAAQLGAAGLPVVIGKNGELVQIAPPMTGPTGKPLIRNAAGDLVEFDHLSIGADRRAVFADAAGKTLELRPPLNARAAVPATPAVKTHQVVTAQRFIVDGNPILIDPSGNVIDAETGQAGGGGVLQAQAGSLVYYVTMVNDVYAYFQTGVKDNQILPGTQFPTTQANLNQVITFAAAHGKTFTDPNALAIELKTSWVEAGGLPNLNGYITMTAVVPTYDMSSNTLWTPNGEKTVELALVGAHVVGSAAGHPEMIWATFEHFGNTPNAPYTYNSTTGVKTVPQNTAGTWLLAANGAVAPFNVPNMSLQSNGNIQAASGHTNGPSATLRSKVWGAASDVSPNPIDGSTTNSNTEMILINNSIRSMMPAGDVRGNYFMMGATWTIGGAAPNSSNQVGTSLLANSTMETFHQGPDNTAANGASNCFDCHTTNTVTVSHIFNALKPLF